jgi:hypothetical protein
MLFKSKPFSGENVFEFKQETVAVRAELVEIKAFEDADRDG